jgi:hypothetical protein
LKMWIGFIWNSRMSLLRKVKKNPKSPEGDFSEWIQG